MDTILIRYLHIFGAILIFGTGLGTAFHMWCAHRTGDPRVIAAVGRSTVMADWIFTTPAVVLQPLTGFALAWSSGWSFTEGWILAALALYALAGACWLPVVWLQMRMRSLAQAADKTGTDLPRAYRRYARFWFWLGWPAFIAMLLILHLMIARPRL